MRIAKYTKIIIALLMMAFIGQAVASIAMSCLNEASQSQLQEQLMDSSVMNHSQHKSMNLGDSLDSSECCSEGDCSLGDCSLGACSTAMLPVAQSTFLSNFSLLTAHYLGSVKNQLTLSLYRPPISR
tara:strand:- start:715 stop:1095 length:381 start_codon:yes stop_codon:yes gene_type:complete